MSSDLLRRAASLMRERAEAATPGPWTVKPHGARHDCMTVRGVGDEHVAYYTGTPDAAHIAAMHPAVALAVADWLDAASAKAEAVEASGLTFGGVEGKPALAVARAYLGEAEVMSSPYDWPASACELLAARPELLSVGIAADVAGVVVANA